MNDQVITENPAIHNGVSTEEDLNSFEIPLDPLFFEGNANFVPELAFDDVENYDFDLSFDDLDDLYLDNNGLLSTKENFTSGSGHLPQSQTDQNGLIKPDDSSDGYLNNFATDLESGSSGISGDLGSDVRKYLNCSPSEAGSCDSGDRNFDSARVANSPISSQRSENVGSGLSGTMNAASPDSGNCVVDQKVKSENYVAKVEVPKRKDFGCDSNCGESRNHKLRRSENGIVKSAFITSDSQGGVGEGLSEEEEKRRARLMRNRESAQLSRQRKKHYVEELEDKVRAMNSTIAELNSKISYFMAENVSLRQQLSSSSSNVNGICPPPVHPPMGSMGYPWMMPFPPYVVKPQGSQTPLVPIPKLKPQQPAQAAKPKKVKTKKVASVSLLGLLFFVLLFGGLVPMMNVKFSGMRESGVIGFAGFGAFTERFRNQNRGKVLVVNKGYKNSSYEDLGIQSKKEVNGSEPLVASLFVPRNHKLVKIDGNLIIHSVIASERAMAPHEKSNSNNHEDTALAIPNIGSLGQKHLCHGADERQKVLTSGSADLLKDHFRSSAADGKMQQWFHEGIAGPMLGSGMCTEVFQFDVSPASGAIVPQSPVTDTTAENRQNVTRINKGKSRRALRGLAIPLPKSDLNITREHAGRNSQQDGLQSNKTVSPMIVSVLVDPREAGDGGIDGMIPPKSLSRIFVVVLMDRVKYVTYSCGLPRIGPHLVTA